MENKTIYAKLFAAKQQIGKVSKNATNPHFKNTYADLNAIIDTVEPILMANGLILLQPISHGKVCTWLIDSETSEKVVSEMDLPNIVNPQQMGSAITYFRRYTLQSLLSLQAVDDDGNEASKPVKPTIETERVKTAITQGDKAIKILIEKFDLSEEQKQLINNK